MNESSQPLKNAGIAAVLSVFFSGFGQIYNGEIGKGLLFMLIQGVNLLLCLIIIGFITYPIMWIYAIYDAYKSAERINKRNYDSELLH